MAGPAAYIPVIMFSRLATLFAFLWFGSVESVHAQQRGYPSLLRRPVESRDRDSELAKAAAELTAPRPLDAALVTELGRLSRQAKTGGAAFERDFAASDRAVAGAGGASVSSESWIVAQQALSVLDASRFDSISALAGMDNIYVEQINSGGDVVSVEGYRTPVLAMVDRQNDRLDSLRARLTRP